MRKRDKCSWITRGLALLLIGSMLILTKLPAKAALETDTETGNIVFQVTEKAATGGIRYRTIGFEIKRCIMGSTTRHPSGDKLVVSLDNMGNAGSYNKYYSGGTAYSSYSFDRDYLLEAIKNYYPSWYNEVTKTTSPQWLIFDGIMTVVYNEAQAGELSGGNGFQKNLGYIKKNNYPGLGTGSIFAVYDYDGGEYMHLNGKTNNPSSLMSAYPWANATTIIKNFNIPASFNAPMKVKGELGILPLGHNLIQSAADFQPTPSYYTGNEPVNSDFNWDDGYIPVLEQIKNKVQADNWYGSVNYQMWGDRVDFKLKFKINYKVQVWKKTGTKTVTSYKKNASGGYSKVTSTADVYNWVTEPRQKDYDTTVSREAYYWAVNNLYVYKLNSLSVTNNSFPSTLNYSGPGGVSVERQIFPINQYNGHTNWDMCLPSGYAASRSGYTYNVTIPITASSYEAGVSTANSTKENYIKYPITWNDRLVVNGKVFLDNKQVQTTKELKMTDPYVPFTVSDRVGVEREQVIQIPYNVRNGYYGTKFVAIYGLVNSYNTSVTGTRTFAEQLSTTYTMDEGSSNSSKRTDHIIQFDASDIWSVMK